jgi:muramoyltetrapeptide carboxypeptidase
VIKPKKLQKGDLIGIISPASAAADSSHINSGVSYLESFGYRVIVGKNVGKERGYLAGTDEQRLDDLHDMFKNKEVKAIICLRGGYGAARLLDKINYRLIKANPKIFVGYSDITALQLAFFQKADMITFAGPMLSSNFANEVEPFTEENFWKIVTSNKKIGRINLPKDDSLIPIQKGNQIGRIIGGNLTLINSLIGTEYFPSMKNKILFIEEVGETPYRIDRIFNQLKLMKIFEQVNGIIFGAFTDCVENNPDKRSLSIGEVIEDYFEKIKKPIAYNLPHGHIPKLLTIPQGIRVKLNASRGFMEFLEAAVS